MAGYNREFQSVAEAFVKQYYTLFDNPETRQQVMNLYHPECMLCFEDAQEQFIQNVTKKLMALPFGKINREITKLDSQPTSDGGVLIMILGQLQADQDRPLGYTHVFQLAPSSGSLFVKHEFFRLELHNIAVAQ